ncbi:MAG: dienelactone hydrolase family protein [Verrucomicrobiota bacterium]
MKSSVFSALMLVAVSQVLTPLFAETFTPYTAETVPETVADLWADIDPRAEPLQVEVIREWEEDGAVVRYLRYTVCTFQGVPCQVAALYIFPVGLEQGPAFVWAHGGGQRADKSRGLYFARHGYASIDFNWGGREVVEGEETNTDWGKLDPSQGPRFYPKSPRESVKLNLEPDDFTIDPVVSPRNGNWYLLALAGRRAISFLEQQPEVDPEKIGFTGYSMGGNITSYCAIDPRLKAVVAMVGGTGFLMEDFRGLENSSRWTQYRNPELFAATLDSSVYWPLVKCPVLFLNATNDFHGIMERSYQCADRLPHDNWHASYNLHYNHSLRREQYAALKLWFDHHLKGVGNNLPQTPEAKLSVVPKNGLYTFVATLDPARLDQLLEVEVLYTWDPNPRTRHWKTAPATLSDGTVTAAIKSAKGLPLLVFANCTYRIAEPFIAFEDVNRPADSFTITSQLASHYPERLDLGKLRESAEPTPLFHDFRENGLEGWGTSSRRSSLRTYRFQDPTRETPGEAQSLVFEVSPSERRYNFVLRVGKNRWLLPKRGEDDTFRAVQPVPPGSNEARFSLADFSSAEGLTMPDWEGIVTLDFEVVHTDRGGGPIDLTAESNRDFLGKVRWE